MGSPKNSYVYWIPFIQRLDVIVMVAWGLMFLQILRAFLYCTPRRCIDTGYRSEPDGYHVLFRPLVTKVWHQQVAMELALVSRMVHVTGKSVDWTLERARHEEDKDPKRCLKMLCDETSRVVSQCVLYGLFEKVVMCELQITVFACERALMRYRGHP